MALLGVRRPVLRAVISGTMQAAFAFFRAPSRELAVTICEGLGAALVDGLMVGLDGRVALVHQY